MRFNGAANSARSVTSVDSGNKSVVDKFQWGRELRALCDLV